MAQDDNQLPVALPETLRRQFANVEKRLWRVETIAAVYSIVGGLSLSLLALFVSDRLWNTPVWLRCLLLGLGLAASAAALSIWLRNWVLQRRDLRALANLVQKKFRRLGDRLLGIVELSNERQHAANFSPELYDAAITQVAEEAARYDFRESVNPRPARNMGAAMAGLCGILAIAAVILPQALANSFTRWIHPGSATPRYTLVDVEDMPRQIVVPHGEPFQITGKIRYKAFWRPEHVVGQIGRQPTVSGTVQSGTVKMAVPAQMQEGLLRLKVGDCLREIKILPHYRPSLTELAASIHLPDYLRYPVQTQAVRSGSLMTLEGSRLSFQGKTSRPLASAQMHGEGGSLMTLNIKGDEFASDATQVDGLAQFTIDWSDDLGLTNAAPLRLAVQTQKDAPPSPDMPDLPHEMVMLATDVLEIRVVAHDDFGVRDLGVMWECFSDTPTTVSSTEVKVQTASPQEKKAEKVFRWSPSLYRVPADSVVEIQGYARDFFPERERAKTPVYRIQVLSAEKHAEMLRQQLESVLGQVEEVSRLEEKILNNTREIQDNPGLPENQKNARLNQAKEDQLQNAANLQQLAKQGRQTMQEAMKNPMVSEKAVQDFSRTMQQWQKLSEGAMKQAANSLQSAQQEASNRDQHVSEAVAQEQQALQELQKQQSKNSDNMDQLQAMTFAQRLRRIGTQENEASERLLNNTTETIGLRPHEVPPKIKEFESILAKGQEAVQKDADTLQAEISRFFERTHKTNYFEVSKEMKDARVSEELEVLGGMIRDNISLESSSTLTNWANRFQAWGDKLEPKSSESASGKSSQGQPGKKKDLAKQLIALLRLREKQLTLREQTSLLDEQKGDPANYKDQANALASTQEQIAKTLDGVHQETEIPELDTPFEETARSMGEVQTLLQKPQTDKVADQAHLKSIDLLSDLINLINEQAQRPSQQSSSQQGQENNDAEEMAFLTQMMKDAHGNQPPPPKSPVGGMGQHGGTDRAATAITGNAKGRAPGSRSVNKAAGVLESSPAEFREALENYYRAIENKK